MLNDLFGRFGAINLGHVDVHEDQFEILKVESLARVNCLETILREEREGHCVDIAQFYQSSEGQSIQVVIIRNNNLWWCRKIKVVENRWASLWHIYIIVILL